MKARLLVLILILHPAFLFAENWPQWRGMNRDGQWNEPGAIKAFKSDAMEIAWRVPISSGYTGPTVADGRVFVMDRIVEPQQTERILCFNAKNGSREWIREYPCDYVGIGYTAGPRASVTVENGRAYALGAMGHLHCLDVTNSEVLWKRDLNKDYRIQKQSRSENRMPMWGIAASPLIFNGSSSPHSSQVVLA